MAPHSPLPPDIAESKILLLEGISDTAADLFRNAGFDHIDRRSGTLTDDELVSALQGVRILGIRSRSQVDDAVLAQAGYLRVVGCFSVGTNQIALDAAQCRGIPVFNAPFSNTRSVAELTIAESVMLLRRIFPRPVAAHAGGWQKSARGSRELRGKTLGIVGYGNIGSTVGAVNFPQVQLPPRVGVSRFIQVQRNLPGELQRLDEIFAQRNVNIAAQHYQTAGEIGYVVMDAEGSVDDAADIVAEIKTLPGTLRARVLR